MHSGFTMSDFDTITPRAAIFHHQIRSRGKKRYDNMYQISGSFSFKESVGLICLGMSICHYEIFTSVMLGNLSPTDS